MALREARAKEAAENDRIDKLKEAAIAKHRASDPEAQRQSTRVWQDRENRGGATRRGSSGTLVIPLIPGNSDPRYRPYMEQTFPR